MDTMTARWRSASWSWLVVLAGCGQSKATDDAPPFKEGSRLKAVYQQAEGAPPFFVSWYDTHLAVDCLFADVGLPDRQVCLPTTQVGFPDNLIFAHSTGDFSDSNCTKPLFYHVSGQERFVLRATPQENRCTPLIHLFTVGAESAAGTGSLFRLRDPANPASCEVQDLRSHAQYELGAEIPLESLVSGIFRPGPGSGRIVPLEIIASDGSVQPAGAIGRVDAVGGGEAYQGVFPRSVAWDKERGEMVSIPNYLGGEEHWLPELLPASGSLFADAACSAPVVVSERCTLPGLAFAGGQQLDGCNNFAPVTFFQPGAPIEGVEQLFYLDVDLGHCLPYQAYPVPLPATVHVFEPSTIPVATTFPAATQMHTGAKQLQLIQAATVDGPAVRPLGFWDRAHAQACAAFPHVLASDDTVRCLPWFPDVVSIGNDQRFADAVCSVPIVSRPQNDCHPTPSVALRAEYEHGDASAVFPYTVRAHFYPVGEPALATTYSLASGQCAELPPGEGVTWHEIGPELPASYFAEVKLVRPE